MPDLEMERDARIALLLDEAMAELRAARTIDVAAWQARYPDFAAELPALLDTVRNLDTAVEEWKMIATSDEPLLDSDVLAGPAEQEQSIEPVPARIGRYRILDRLGEGGMGTVYKAHDPQLDRVVALKMPRFDKFARDRATAMQRFMREARAAAAIRHPHVCPIHDVGEENNMPFVVMAYVEGKSLAELLSDNLPFDNLKEAVRLAAQVATALDAVHAHGIIHRDLKPGNILLEAESGGRRAEGQNVSSSPLALGSKPSALRAILTDFGLARPEKDVEHLTMDGAVLGTPAYMAPEQATGELDRIGPWTDIYSLGVVLYQMLTGRVPFQGPPLKILSQITHDSPPPPSSVRTDLDPALEAIVLKAMARRPEDRYQSAKQLGEALNSWLAAQATFAARTPSAVRSTGPETELLPEGAALENVGWAESARPTNPVVATPKMVGLADSAHPTKPGQPITPRLLTALAAAAAVLFALGGVVYRISTDRGELVINCHDDAVEVTIKRNGKPVVEGLEVSHGQEKTTVRSGDIEVLIRGDHADDFTVTSNQGGQPKFVLSRDGKAVVEIERKLTVAASPSTDGDPDRRAAEWVLSIGGTISIK
ncbi:MAG: serine/threonine protein kinase, partial [Planctomycetes bacterium]|nr:serine/threonine protein kinase [Planctomycetota bacterium]